MVKATIDNLLVLVVALAATSLMIQTTEAALYKVGDDLGWTIPPGGAATYAAWAAKHSFFVNDMIMFNFTEGDSDLALVTMEDYAACNTTNPLYEFEEPMTLKFLGSDTFYFTSTYEGHCTGGQKITIYVAPSSSPSPSPSAAAAATKSSKTELKIVSQKIMGSKRN